MQADLTEEAEKLKMKLAQIKCKISEWTGQFVQNASTGRDQHRAVVDQQLEILREVHKCKLDQANELSNLQILQVELQTVTQKRDVLLHNKELLNAELQHVVLDIQKEREMHHVQEKSIQENYNQLDKIASLYRDTLALEFRKTAGGWLQVIFRHIDPTDVDQPFYFFVKITDDGKYIVNKCEPSVADIDVLVDKLNSTNNFRAFMLSIRKRFKAQMSQ